MHSIIQKIKSSEKLKRFVLSLLIPRNQARPRKWVKIFLNPLLHKKGKRALIRKNIRLDVLPFNNFSIGADSTIEDYSTINNGVGDIHIGERTRIGMGNVLIGPVTIGNDVMFAQNVVLSGLNHGFEDVTISPSKQPISKSPILVEDEVWIGANVTVTAGVKLGKHSVIGSGSVVTKDVPSYSVAVGNPARVIKKFNFEKKLWEKV
jgi:acetyltransferase-like isoleucine patch superfamily enzyme